MNYTNKKALITGAANGLGKELAVKLHTLGAEIIALDIDLESLEALKSQLRENIQVFKCDLSDREEILNVIDEIKVDHLDILINNAAIGLYPKSFEETSFEDWELTMKINLDAVFVLTQNLFEKLTNADFPTIINIGSKSGHIAEEGKLAYSTSKFALRGFTLNLAKDLKDRNFNVKLITVGSMLTNFGFEEKLDRIEKQEHGKKYLHPENVAGFIVDNLDREEVELEIMPDE